MAQLFKLTGAEVRQLLDRFKTEFPRDVVTRSGFKRVFSSFLARNSVKTVLNASEVDSLLDRLFTIFDRDHNGIVDSRELVTGLSVLCVEEGSPDKIRTAFDVYDVNGDGVITMAEMVKYLTSVFTVTEETNPTLFQRYGVKPDELAEITARSCFEEADVNRDGVITYAEFKRWFTSSPRPGVSPSSAASGARAGAGAGAGTGSDASATLPPTSQSGPFVQLQAFRESTGLGGLSAAEVFAALKTEARHGTFTQSAFLAAVIKVLRRHGRLPSGRAENTRLRHLLKQVFQAFDIDRNGVVDMTELGSGLSVLCGGTRDEKVQAAFELFDLDGNGVITLPEMTTYLTSVFKVLWAAQPDMASSMDTTPEHLGRVTAEECFRQADADGSGGITFDEFRAWYDDSMHQPLLPEVVSALPGWLAKARHFTGLEGANVSSVMAHFYRFASKSTGSLDRAAFGRAFNKYLVRVPSSANVTRLLDTIFAAFDADGNNQVDITELVCGLSLLCGSTPEERVRAVFDVFDSDGSGTMSKAEMRTYLTSVFSLMYASDADLQARVGLTPAQLAEATVDDCFAQADSDNDGAVSFDEFFAWQSQPAQFSVSAATPTSLAQAKLLTGLGNVPVDDALRVFAAHAIDGEVHADGFVAAFDLLARRTRVPASPERNALLRRLFAAFDTDGTGTLDFAELSSGLTVLCDGPPMHRIESAFRLFDFNGDGSITMDEMTAYFTAVFRVLFEVNPDAARAAGVSPEALARATTLDVFAEADLDADNALSLEEFKRWYRSSGSALMGGPSSGGGSDSGSGSSTSALTPADVLVLDQYSASDVVRVVAEHCSADGRLSHDDFLSAFNAFVKPGARLADVRAVLDQLFSLFDTDSDGCVSVSELAAGVSVLCGGTGDDKVEAVFEVYDLNHDGFVSYGEMVQYLRAVFTVLYSTKPGTQERMGVPADELARATAAQVFQDADVNQDGRLSLEEFKAWYSHGAPGGAAPQSAAVLGAAADVQSQVAATMDGAGADAPAVDATSAAFADFKQLTGLASLPVSRVLTHFASFADADDRLSRRAFHAAFASVPYPDGNDPNLRRRARAARAGLFDLFDTNGDGVVDFAELASGLSVLCEGSGPTKTEVAFAMYDLNGDGFISPNEMTAYLTSVFKVLFASSAELAAHGMTPEELATATTEQAFAEADTDGDGRLSLEEFKAWTAQESPAHRTSRTSRPPSAATPPAPPAAAAAAAAAAATAPPTTLMADGQPMTLQEAARLTGLGSAAVSDVLEVFNSHLARDGSINRKAFFDACRTVQARASMSMSPSEWRKSTIVLNQLFNLFDADGNGLVDARELAAGLSVLCGGSQDSRMEAAFKLYDANGDGFIQLEEMVEFLESVFKVLYATMPGTGDSVGVSPRELAEATARQCFEEADTNRDGRLSREEYLAWYKSPASAGSSARGVVANAAARPAWLTLSEVRRLLNLSSVPMKDVAKVFAHHTDRTGRLSRAAFNAAFSEFVSRSGGGGVDAARKDLVLRHLFSLFDTDGDDAVDFTELMSGLSVVCGGSRDDKVESAFALYDFDGNGYIEFEEMVLYLTSVFKVLYAAQDSASSIGATPEELAQATAYQCFLDADLDKDGRLSLEEFKRWYNPAAVGAGAGAGTGTGAAGRRAGAPSHATTSAASTSARNAVLAASSTPHWLTLDLVRSLLGLSSRTVSDVASKFARYTDSDGLLDREAFNKAFRSLVPPASRADAERLRFVLSHLFNMFDADGNGVVDFTELSSGLSVLCGGDREDKIRTAFSLYDFNGDGTISLSEMQLYLASVFRVLYGTDPALAERVGASPDELARITAEQCFADADVNSDGQLTWEEFKAWYERAEVSGGIRETVVDSANLGTPSWVSLAEVKRLTNLQNYAIEDVMDAFAVHADGQGLLSRAAFNRCFSQFVEPQDSSDAARTRLVLSHLFDLFDTDHNGSVDFRELASGLSVLCGGSRDEKIEAAFALYDFNGDGCISLDEMQMYLESVFTVLYESEPGTLERLNVSAKELACATAQQCFLEADLNGDGMLTLDEFKRWYSGQITSDADVDVRRRVVGLAAEPPSWVNIAEVKRLLGLRAHNVADVMTMFARVADEDGLISRHDFNRLFASLVDTTGMNSRDRDRAALLLSRLFDIFDKDGNGVVDFSELASGVSILCGGSQEDKVRACFEAFDADGDGYIQLEEMELYLASVFKVLFEMSPETQEAVGATPEDLAAATAAQAFEEADTDGDGRISFDEFRVWYSAESMTHTNELAAAATTFTASSAVRTTGAGAGSGAGASAGAASASASRSVLDEVRRVLSLDRIPLSDMLDVFTAVADPAGNLSLSMFEACIQHLQEQAGVQPEELSATAPLTRRLFALFDTDGNGVVDRLELASGLSVLCSGTEEDKVKAAFALYDVNKDGFISLDEMTTYLTSVYKVIYDTVPGTEASVGVSAEVLGAVTAEQCFAEADLNHDGKLSEEEFKRWFSLNSGPLPHGPDSPDRAKARQAALDREQASNGVPPARTVRKLLGLDQFGIQEVFDAFQEQATGGVLTYGDFTRAFALLVHLSGGSMEDDTVAKLVDSLFDVFDRDGNGLVSYDELAAGLSVFCVGTTDDKVLAAFQLYDANQDGFVSMDEMERYLRSVFRIMYHLNPSFEHTNGVSVDELAHETARRAFLDCDANQDGLLSFEEFKTWYSQTH